MDALILIWNVLSVASTVVALVAAAAATYYCFRGFVPVLIRLGNGLWRRKIAIFASGDALTNLEILLLDLKLFNRTNIIRVSGDSELEAAEKASVFLVHWPDCQDNINAILQRKKEQTALIVYAPQGQGSIPVEVMVQFELRKNVVVNNFRGRLLNDLVTSMITTGYEKN